MQANEVKEKHPETYDTIFQEGVRSVDTKTEIDAVLDAERKRAFDILGIESVSIEARREAIKKGLEVQEAKAYFFDIQSKNAQQNFQSATQSIPDPVPVDGKQKDQKEDVIQKEIKAYMESQKCSYTEAAKAVMSKHPEYETREIKTIRK